MSELLYLIIGTASIVFTGGILVIALLEVTREKSK